MATDYLESQADLLGFIRITTRSEEARSPTSDGILYQEIPFAGYETVAAYRENSAQRVQLLSEWIDFSGKTVLDIGCNIGYFCFELARRGAQCWGIDDDADAIFIARSLKHIHQMDNVHFIHGEVSEATIDSLLKQAGHFDVVLLNSVVHWLIYELGSMRRLISFLNLLHAPTQQYIVYEPSSSNSAYYPEELTPANINSFFVSLGVDRYQKIGECFASNVNGKREIWLGERDIQESLRPLEDILDDPFEQERLVKGKGNRFHIQEDKLCLYWRNWYVKTVISRDSPYNCLLMNELHIAKRLMKNPEYVPLLIAGLELRGRIYLVYEHVKGISLTEAFVHQHEVWWISRELLGFLNQLRLLGLVHNDIQPQNILLLKHCKQIRVVNYELGGVSGAPETNRENKWLPFEPQTLEEERLLLRRMRFLNEEYRSSRGPGYHENDRYAINKVIALMKNRRTYRRERFSYYWTRFVDRVKPAIR